MEMNEIYELKLIVNSVFKVNIDIETRLRSHVDARRAYAKILRDRGFSYHKTAVTIGKDHATIIHYLRNIDHIFAHDKYFIEKYKRCKDLMIGVIEDANNQTPEKVYLNRIKDLQSEVQELNIKLNNANEQLKKNVRIKSIIKLINERICDEDVEILESKIRIFLNGIR
jgi:predicted transcriptional regulator